MSEDIDQVPVPGAGLRLLPPANPEGTRVLPRARSAVASSMNAHAEAIPLGPSSSETGGHRVRASSPRERGD